ncbi:AraC family transcriptional regulator [Flavobacterium sp. xlx-214]|uniref:helix-turn-helix domain-containing protein n=1 Tax=unclassified Flavobacterium TaxID=196869 RepID=UPI0013D08CFF|nr:MULTISPECIES: helix-turn-helix domain-containing protein [unclassified Flavobacterium]MBA5794088.1 AraC family transcriptional regulator [Flavobacterium sp. xlx-221]QMI83997.1 AraC family transcriptional regulator [Flavobacterium sp. xlx-214]
MVTDVEFACLLVAFTLASLSYFFNAKYSFYYLEKAKAIAFISVLALQLTILLCTRYYHLQSEIYYLIPFNVFYIAVFYQALIKVTVLKVPKDYFSYSILMFLFILYVVVFQVEIVNDAKIYFFIYQISLLVLLGRCIVKYITVTKLENAPTVNAKWYFQSLIILSVAEIALFFYQLIAAIDIKINNVFYLVFISIILTIFIVKSIVYLDHKSTKEQVQDVEKEEVVQEKIFLIDSFKEYTTKKDKYKNSKLKDEDIVLISKKIQRISEEKLFLDPELNLDKLSALLKVPKYSLSQVFSSVCATNFNDYINYLRCEFALQFILKENSSQNIIEIAYESGFNSKTSFYRAFNKVYNCTPLEYKQRTLN